MFPLRQPVGTRLADLDTPSCCLDADVFERNLAHMSRLMRQWGKSWRPHAKCHKSPDLARKLMAAGAIGVTVAKVSEAEVFAAAGIRDILIAHLVVGQHKVHRVARLCLTADPIVALDHYAQASPLNDACRSLGVSCRVVIEINVGFERVGVRPGTDMLDLARGISGLSNLRLAGVMGYEGHLLQIKDENEKSQKLAEAMRMLGTCRTQLLKAGLPCDIVSAGGTGSYEYTGESTEITELQACGGVFGDPFYTKLCGVGDVEPALRVLATVVSRTRIERAVVDVGRKGLHGDFVMPIVRGVADGRPLPAAQVAWLSAEHGVINLGPQSFDLKIGDKLELIPGYTDLTTMLYDEFYVIRNGRVEAIWPIARGTLR